MRQLQQQEKTLTKDDEVSAIISAVARLGSSCCKSTQGDGGVHSCNQSLLDVALMAVRAYAESHTRPSSVTQMQAAEMTGVSRSTIGKMIRHGKLKLNAFGQIPISEIDRALGPDN